MNERSSDLFVRATPRSEKVMCTVCGAIGWEGPRVSGTEFSPWQERCLAGHPYPCNRCERRFVSAAGRANHQRGKHPRSWTP